MNTPVSIAASVRWTGAAAILGLLLLAGCSALPQPPARATLYDFGPGATAEAAPASVTAALPPLALADVEAPGLADASTGLFYRLAYADAQQLRPYTQARWSQPPAVLVQQRLREQLGLRRTVLHATDATALRTGKAPSVLRVSLEEFSQVFASPADSSGLLRLRATVVDAVPGGEVLVAQRVFVVRRPAPSADAAGGARALAEAADQVAQDLAQWLEAQGR
ncbi:MAG: membrane integrity-associated transporter subunit PqiC [Acidovorax sp.]|nr:membrane integrity-associated transporter subunit PqiC [Acidovorax sp.]